MWVWAHSQILAKGRANRAFRALVLLCSSIIDRLYYNQWTFPALRFLYFNVAQSLSVFYGSNPWHYYLTQGYPLLLTTFLPFGIIGLYQSLSTSSSTTTTSRLPNLSRKILYQLSTTSLIVPTLLSLISHKEVRFIYPLLPPLHILAASPFTSYFLPALTSSHPSLTPRRLILISLALSSLSLALFTTTLHQTAPLSVLSYLRSEYTANYLTQPPSTSGLKPAETTMTVSFLMPCHSTPWRSHLVFPGIRAWALGCEPPVNLNASARAAYVDEADRFYDNPTAWLSTELGNPPKGPQKRAFFGFGRSQDAPLSDGVAPAARSGLDTAGDVGGAGRPWDGGPGKKMWTEYVVFFAQLEPAMRKVLKGSVYRECWRGWNSYGHDDWRRRGDVVVWCVRGSGTKREDERGRYRGKGPREKEKLRRGLW